MATFANKASNLSALESKFDRLLKIRHPGKESHGYHRSEEEKQKNAEVFFATQRNRAGKIEKELMAATGNILPPSKDSKTITELAELCRLTQLATREKLEALRSYLENEGYTVTSPRANNSKEGYSAANNVAKSSPTLDRKSNGTKPTGQINVFGLTYDDDAGETSLPLVTNIGGPLESVIEAEYETDGMTTPGSALESPFFSSAQRRGNSSVTPSLSARNEKIKNRRKSSSFSLRSPVTPSTLDKLRRSDSTNDLLHHATDDEININDMNYGTELHNDTSFPEETPNKSLVQYQKRAESQEEQQHLFEFREEDDMITLDTTMTKNTTLCSPMMYGGSNSEKRSFEEERSQFFARMEGILERVEETIMEDSQSPMSYNQDDNDSMHTEVHRESSQSFTNRKDFDELYERSVASMRSNDAISVKSNRSEKKTFYEDESETMLADNDEYSGMNNSSDSTNMVATQVAGKNVSKSDIRPFGMSENTAEDKTTYSVNPQRPTHILVDSGMASPAHTNITMDATFMSDVNETGLVRGEDRFDTRQRDRGFINKFMEEDDDNLSTVKPVLDRYRLDASEGSSSGLKVVPNKRSAHRSNKKRTPRSKQGQLPTIAQLSPSLDHILHSRTPKNEYTGSDFISPRVETSERHHQNINSNTPTDRVTKVYRKTPFRKRMSLDVEENDDDENHNPNISAGFSTPYSQEKLLGHNHGTFSISVPPLRHSSIETNRTDSLEKQRSSVVPESLSRQTYLQEETDTIQKIDETIDRIDVELSSRKTFDVRKPLTTAETKTQIDSEFSFDKITIFEFESSPRIVRTSVSRDIANKCLHAIHTYCSSASTQIDGFKFTEREGRDILGLSSQETKNVLISLCHWRRLLMKKDATHGMIFAVNNRKKEADKSFA